MGGIGLGLMYAPAVVTVGQYFSRRLNLATGVLISLLSNDVHCLHLQESVFVALVLEHSYLLRSQQTSYQGEGSFELISTNVEFISL